MTNSGPKMNQKAHGRPHGEATNQTRQKLILLHYSYKSIKNVRKLRKRSPDTQIRARSRGTPNLCIQTCLRAKSINGCTIYIKSCIIIHKNACQSKEHAKESKTPKAAREMAQPQEKWRCRGSKRNKKQPARAGDFKRQHVPN